MRNDPSLCESRHATDVLGSGGLWSAVERMFRRRPAARRAAASAAALDPRELTDHLKRDLGLIDGNDPRHPRA